MNLNISWWGSIHQHWTDWETIWENNSNYNSLKKIPRPQKKKKGCERPLIRKTINHWRKKSKKTIEDYRRPSFMLMDW
jgi:hypothetical protein